MAEESVVDVKETAPVADVQPQEENKGEGSAETPKIDPKVYAKVREDMLKYKAEKKAKDSELEAIKAEIEALKAAKVEPEDEEEPEDTRTKAKVDVLMLIQTDPFAKENLDLIAEKMAENPKLSAQAAIKELKSDFFDRMQKEVSKAAPEVPPKQITPKGNSTLKEAVESDNADPRQIEAYKAQLARLGLK